MRAVLSLTQIQSRYARLFDAEPDFRVNNITIPYHVEAVWNEAAFRAALADLLAAHALLRARVVMQDNKHCFAIEEDGSAQLTIQKTSREKLEEELARAAQTLNAIALPTTTGPLLAIEVITTGQAYWGFVLCVHHLVCDGVSIRILLRDLFDAYQSALDGGHRLKPVPANLHQALAHQEQDLIHSDEGRKRLGWWRAHLGAALTREQTAITSYASPRRVDGVIPLDLAQALQQNAKAAGASLAATLTAAGASAIPNQGSKRVVKRVVAKRDDVYGSIVDNCVDLQCLEYDSSSPLAAQALQLTELTRQASQNSLPVWWIVSQLCPSLLLSRCGPARIEMNIFLPAPARYVDTPRIQVTKVAEQQLTTWPQYDYCFIVQPLVEAAWKATFIYNPQVMGDEDARRVLERFSEGLKELGSETWRTQ
jgi:hypothetical protein